MTLMHRLTVLERKQALQMAKARRAQAAFEAAAEQERLRRLYTPRHPNLQACHMHCVASRYASSHGARGDNILVQFKAGEPWHTMNLHDVKISRNNDEPEGYLILTTVGYAKQFRQGWMPLVPGEPINPPRRSGSAAGS